MQNRRNQDKMTGIESVRQWTNLSRKSPRNISPKLRPKNLCDLRSFMGPLNQMNRFIPNLANLCALLRTLLKKENELTWGEEIEEPFKKITQAKKDNRDQTFQKRLASAE